MRLFFLLYLFLFSAALSAEKVVWSGKVSSSGEPTESVALELRGKYKIKVSGVVNIGKWVEGGEKLSNDACYSFSDTGKSEKMGTLQNSLRVPICREAFRKDHTYESPSFIANQNRLHFWVYDIDYDDNSGEFLVEIIQL